ncbi:MAG: DNA cytosine methyltransferase [Butyrivibrio sp.]|nr:DNA cytosine methyltransferase [Butyrivibrio sp.]
MELKIFSFFSGCGFLDLGFEKAGYDIELVNEFSSSFLRAYKYARKNMNIREPRFGYYNCDVNDFFAQNKSELKKHLKEARQEDCLVGFIGGPPCPDFSVAGKQRGKDGDNGKLSLAYVELIIKNKPDFFLFENVKGLWSTAKHRSYYDELKQKLADAGYLMTDRLTNAIEYGVAQDRDRILLFGIRKEIAKKRQYNISEFPWQKNIKYNLSDVKNMAWPTVDEFIEDGVRDCPDGLPRELTVEYWFRKNDVYNHPNSNAFFTPRGGLIKMQTVEEGDSNKKSYKRIHRWRYSPTAAYGNNEVHLHPYKARRLSVAECLAIQSLPKEFILPPDMSLSDSFKTIGNGVPFLLSYGIAKTIRDFLESNDGKDNCK